MEDKEPEISLEFNLSFIFILCGTNNVDHNCPEEIVSGLILTGISVQAQCHCKLLLPRDKKLSGVTVSQIEFINTQS